MEQDIFSLLDEGRNSLTSYCINECKSGCCRKGKLLLLNNKERELIVGDEKDQKEAINKGILQKQETGNYHFNFEKNGPCQHLEKSGLCGVYKDKRRPTICSDYPLFKVGNYVVSAGNCPGVVNGELDKYLEKAKKLGYKVV